MTSFDLCQLPTGVFAGKNLYIANKPATIEFIIINFMPDTSLIRSGSHVPACIGMISENTRQSISDKSLATLTTLITFAATLELPHFFV